MTALVFRALGHAKRLQLLQLLLATDEPLSIHQLRDATRNPSIWEHMKTLQAAGFIEVIGPGRLARWRLVEGSLERAQGLLSRAP
ncbi:helix-turn-helix domain-containing protein [Yimella sp. cx-573]|nr:helix-turn-helix domain-containing protein [Yimella sp. cx-573]